MNGKFMILGLTAILLIAVGGIALAIQPQDGTPPQEEKKKGEQEEISKNYADALRAKAAELEQRQKDIVRREQELSLLEQELIKKMRQFDQDKAAFEAEKNAWQQQRTSEEQQREGERVQKIAAGYKNVKANVAAAQLTALYAENKTTALIVINELDDRTFGKIFSKMADPVLAAQIVEDLKQWRTGAGDSVVGN